MRRVLVYLLIVVVLLGTGAGLGIYVLSPVLSSMNKSNTSTSTTTQQSTAQPVIQSLGKFTTNLSDPKYVIQISVNLEFYDKKVLAEIQKNDPSFLVIQDELLKYLKNLKPQDFTTEKGITAAQQNLVKRINELYGKTVLVGVLFGADTVVTVMP